MGFFPEETKYVKLDKSVTILRNPDFYVYSKDGQAKYQTMKSFFWNFLIIGDIAKDQFGLFWFSKAGKHPSTSAKKEHCQR